MHPVRAQAGGTVPRLADYACSRDHDAYGERGHAAKQQQFMNEKPGHDSPPSVSSTGTREFHNSELVSWFHGDAYGRRR